MLNLPSNAKAARGFSLIELMIATTIGLIVSGAAVALIVSIDQSNSETIQSTRLTQELRALAAVIADDIKRSRGLDDPIGMVGQGTTSACGTTVPAQPCYTITPTTGSDSCATYGYTGYTSANPADSSYASERSTYIYHDIRRTTDASGVGSIVLDELTFSPATGGTIPSITVANCLMTDANGVATASTPATLSSTQVDITDLTFNWISTSEIDLSITAKFKAGDSHIRQISRTFTQPIFVRSASAN